MVFLRLHWALLPETPPADETAPQHDAPDEPPLEPPLETPTAA
ncbi:hypothetical protein [Caulobacter endophyticus]|nr:hypothetical protein [Caulobacter endophyticus]